MCVSLIALCAIIPSLFQWNHPCSFVFIVCLCLCSITAGSKNCQSYTDITGEYHSSKSCWIGFCCGTCSNRYCCQDTFMRLSEDQQEDWYFIQFYSVIDNEPIILSINCRSAVDQCFPLLSCVIMVAKCCCNSLCSDYASEVTGSGVFLCATTITKIMCESVSRSRSLYSHSRSITCLIFS